MKILHIIPSYKPADYYGGPIQSVAALCEALSNLHDVTVYTTNANGPCTLDIPGGSMNLNGVKVYYCKRLTGDHTNWSPALLKRLIKHVGEFDVVHVHAWWNMNSIPAVLICYFKRIKPVVSLRGTMSAFSREHTKSTIKRAFQFVLGKRLLKYAALHATSKKEAAEIQSVVKRHSIFVIPNIPEPLPLKKRILQDRLFRILFLGRINKVKNLEFLIDTARLLKIKCEINIVGNGSPEYIKHLKRISEDIPFLFWHGHMNGDEKLQMLADHDLLVLPSYTENYGNVVLEALNQGTPVLISPHVGSRDFVEAHKLGWVAPLQVNGWKEAIEEIYADEVQRRFIRSSARNIIEKELCPEKLAGDYIRMYQVVTIR